VNNRIEQSWDLPDFDKAIKLHEEVLLLPRPGHLNRPSSLGSLTIDIKSRFVLVDEVVEEGVNYFGSLFPVFR
jgi:hypothetical protein